MRKACLGQSANSFSLAQHEMGLDRVLAAVSQRVD